MKRRKNLYIHTIGCQMNIYDSEQMVKQLSLLGYKSVSSLETADLIMVNTCSVREKAEQKVFSFLGRLAQLKTENPQLIIGVSGCVAQQEGASMFARVPQLDFVLGTHAISRLASLVKKIETKRSRIADTEMSVAIDDFMPSDRKKHHEVTAFVTIMRGCDNFCSYCVVPYVRGREASRSPEIILDEVRSLVASGVREVTLLGQNVNSYGLKEGLSSFHDLLRMINTIDDLWRIRFTTSHPKDLSDELIQCFGTLEKLCHHIHLPVQSGSNRVLKLMNRRYTREHYLEKIDKLRRHCPDIAVSSDVIVGFPGETHEDFEQTLDLIKRVEYDSLFMFNYSDRPNVPAVCFSGKVPDPEKKERFQRLLRLQEGITAKKHHDHVGSLHTVLVEGKSKKQGDMGNKDVNPAIPQWTGRTSTNRIVNFIQDTNAGPLENIKGRMIQVKILKAFPHSLWGRSDQMAS